MANDTGGRQVNEMQTSVPPSATSPLGALVREWRRRRRMSQSDLASDANISAKHLSFVETGRARPSRQMLLHLAHRLDIPLRERNTLLGVAGFAPAFRERPLAEPSFDLVRRNVESVLTAFEPHPALTSDRHWTMLSANRAFSRLVSGADPMLLRPPVNLLRLMLHPAGLAPRIVNLAQWRGQLMNRLRRQIDGSGDPVLRDLLDEVWDYPCPHAGAADEPGDMIAVPLRLATIDGELSFVITTTTFAMPLDITVAELSIHAFLPADSHTAAVLRREPHRHERRPELVGGAAG